MKSDKISNLPHALFNDLARFFADPYDYTQQSVLNIKQSFAEGRFSPSVQSRTVIDEVADMVGLICATVSLLPCIVLVLPFALVYRATDYVLAESVKRDFLSESTANLCVSLLIILTVPMALCFVPFLLQGAVAAIGILCLGLMITSAIWVALRIASAVFSDLIEHYKTTVGQKVEGTSSLTKPNTALFQDPKKEEALLKKAPLSQQTSISSQSP